MKTFSHLFERLISIENLEEAYWKARKHKSRNPAIQKFHKHWRLHLVLLHRELKTRTYQPRPLKTFILRDPKTRKICVSEFRDRVVHHALVNILRPIFEPRFIHDSYASRTGKGTTAALKRFDVFLRKVTRNGQFGRAAADGMSGFALKADIKHYFDTVDHAVLLDILKSRIKDEGAIWLAETILDHYDSGTPGKGMPLGNWTSQFFANVYLNELDQFVKHELKAKYYLRYVDDFVLLHRSKRRLQDYEQKMQDFLASLKLEFHPTKCAIIPLRRGVSLLGFRMFCSHTQVRQRNLRKIWARLTDMLDSFGQGAIGASDILDVVSGWSAYAAQGNTYRLRERVKFRIDWELQRRALNFEKRF